MVPPAPASPPATRFTSIERRSVSWLSSIYALRMLGLFLLLPVFAIHAAQLPGANHPYLVGLGLSVYGLTQALLQIAYGAASDRFGRKPVIVFGLIVFFLGSVVCALADSMSLLIAGRALQGAGAVSAAVTAFVADATRDQVRSKAMAMVGGSIALTFAVSMVAAGPLAEAVGLAGIFWLTAVLAVLAIGVVIWRVPAAPLVRADPELTRSGDVLFDPQLLRLNVGVFVLHAVLTALFVVVPPLLVRGGLAAASHAWLYLPMIFISFALMLPPMLVAERRGLVRRVFLGAILFLTASLALAGYLALDDWVALGIFLTAFFVAFNLLEALQPSLVSRLAPPNVKGFAMGVYNTTQSMGFFAGGIIGGVLAKRADASAVFYTCAALCAVWAVVAWRMRPPPKNIV